MATTFVQNNCRIMKRDEENKHCAPSAWLGFGCLGQEGSGGNKLMHLTLHEKTRSERKQALVALNMWYL